MARAPDVFCTVPETHGLMTEPPAPMRRIPVTTAATTGAGAVNDSPTMGARSAPPNQTG